MVTNSDITERLLQAETTLWHLGALLREARQEIDRLRNAYNEQGIELSNYRIMAKRNATRRG